jgi:RimJ/RimL family protein N-acetyltransferase
VSIARNGPSLALCERLGMRREAVLVENEWFKGEWTDEVDYALLERDWAGQHPDGPRSCRWPLTPA